MNGKLKKHGWNGAFEALKEKFNIDNDKYLSIK